jgi:hypothetical protein
MIDYLVHGQVAGVAKENGVAVVAVAALTDAAQRIIVAGPLHNISILSMDQIPCQSTRMDVFW